MAGNCRLKPPSRIHAAGVVLGGVKADGNLEGYACFRRRPEGTIRNGVQTPF